MQYQLAKDGVDLDDDAAFKVAAKSYEREEHDKQRVDSNGDDDDEMIVDPPSAPYPNASRFVTSLHAASGARADRTSRGANRTVERRGLGRASARRVAQVVVRVLRRGYVLEADDED